MPQNAIFSRMHAKLWDGTAREDCTAILGFVAPSVQILENLLRICHHLRGLQDHTFEVFVAAVGQKPCQNNAFMG
jgi:hypothetical protein